MADNILEVEALKAYYQMSYFGVNREVRAVDGITMNVKRKEVYGIAGESSSGKTSFIKVLAAAIRPPLRVISGTATYDFGGSKTDVTVATPAEIDALKRRLEPAQTQKGGEVTFVAAISGGREVELRLPGRYMLDAALRGALKTAPGVALLEDV